MVLVVGHHFCPMLYLDQVPRTGRNVLGELFWVEHVLCPFLRGGYLGRCLGWKRFSIPGFTLVVCRTTSRTHYFLPMVFFRFLSLVG